MVGWTCPLMQESPAHSNSPVCWNTAVTGQLAPLLGYWRPEPTGGEPFLRLR